MKEAEQKRVDNIAKHYDSVDTAERYFRATPPANQFDRIRDGEFQTVFTNLDFNSLPSKEPLALDIGIGGGRYTMYSVNNGIDAIGIDTGINPLKYASERINAAFIRASVTDLPFKKASFDLVICIELLHHFGDEVLEKALEEISDVIKPGGIFVFDVKNKLNPVMWYKYKKGNSVEFTLKARTTKQMAKLAEKHGFEVIKRRGILFPITLFAPYVVFFVKRCEI
jgi:SAM-dependent methyltransferase